MIEKGYTILARNFHCRGGELDIVAKKGDLVVFVEVKARSSDDYGYPSEFVTPRKRKHLRECARYFLLSNGLDNVDIRFDVVGITGKNVEWIENAFMEV